MAAAGEHPAVRLQASQMVAPALARPSPPPLPPPCPAPLPAPSSTAPSLLREVQEAAVVGWEKAPPSMVPTPLAFLATPAALHLLHPRIPEALERHGEGGGDLEHLYTLLLAAPATLATSPHGCLLLLRMVEFSSPTQVIRTPNIWEVAL